MSNLAVQKDFYYAPAIIAMLTPERAREVIAIAQDLAAKTSFADEIHWGRFDVWDDYNKVILEDPNSWDVTEHSGFYGLVRSDTQPFRTPSWPKPHYAISPENSFALFYDDYEHVNTDDTEWAELIHAIIAAVPEIAIVTEEEMNSN